MGTGKVRPFVLIKSFPSLISLYFCVDLHYIRSFKCVSPGNDASKAWTSLRDTFMSNKRNYEVRLASGAPAVSEPTWKFWPVMKWLIDDMKKQSTVSNVEKDCVSNLSPTLQETQSPSPSSADNPDMESLPSTPLSSSNSILSTSSRKRSKTLQGAIDLTISSIDKEIKDLKESFKPEDDMHVYAMSIAAKMRKLTEYQAAMARRDIELLLFNIHYSCPPHPPPQQPTSVQSYGPTQPYVPGHLSSQSFIPNTSTVGNGPSTSEADDSSMHFDWQN